MRNAYLQKQKRDSGCRGGVASNHEDYALEIGQTCNAEPEMVALCTMIDEIKEFLSTANSPIAKMILRHWQQETKRLTESETQDLSKGNDG